MARLKGVEKAARVNIYRTGITRAEVFERTDRLRQEVLALITKRGATPIRVIASQLEISYDAARNYGLYLVAIEAATNYKIGLDTFFEPTGKPYYAQKRWAGTKKPADPSKPAPAEAAPNKHLRVIRLLDRKPEAVSKYEHKANRRSNNGMAVRGSSMSMFDGV